MRRFAVRIGVGAALFLTGCNTVQVADLNPTATASPPPAGTALPCVIEATRTPPPNTPTRIPSSGVSEIRYVDPHVEICASETSLKIGDEFTLIGEAVDIGLPYFYLYLRDGDTGERVEFVLLADKVVHSEDANLALEFISAERLEKVNGVAFDLKARKPITVELYIHATGEVHFGYPGPATWSGGGSESVSIEITGD